MKCVVEHISRKYFKRFANYSTTINVVVNYENEISVQPQH